MNFFFKNYNKLIYTVVLGIVLFSSYLGYKHSVFNQDFHHLSFILSGFIDFNNGFTLFKEIFLQYGPGQVLFFKLIDNFVNINLFSISFITSIIYSANLLLLFIIFRKIVSLEISFLLIILIFLIHPYNIHPWPDYLSGICLSLFFLFLLKKDSKYNFVICACFLFLAIFFRSTYLLNIIFSIIVYNLLFVFYQKENNLKNLFKIFFLILTIFLIFLIYLGSILDWFNQSILFITAYAEETKHLQLYDKITNYVGKYGFIILKIFYYALNSTSKLFNVFNPENILFVFFIIINFIYLFKVIRNKLNLNHYEKKIVFLSILGLSGFIQSLMLMEVFRNINATIGIFLAGLFFLNSNRIFNLKKYSNKFLILCVIYGLVLFIQFPKNKYNNNNFTSFENTYFKNKKISPEVKKYYSNLRKFICNKDDLILTNISWDYMIPHICEGKNLKNRYSIDVRFLKKININEYNRIFIDSELKSRELLFTNQIINNPEIKLIKIFSSPLKPKEWYRDIRVYKLSK